MYLVGYWYTAITPRTAVISDVLTSEPFLVPKKADPTQAAAHFCEVQETGHGDRWSAHLVRIVDTY